MDLKYKALKSCFWLPGDDYTACILNLIKRLLRDGDIIVVSEKAVAIAIASIIDEEKVKPSFLAYMLSRIWMRIAWGFFLGYLCRFRRETLSRLRRYPLIEGSRHKQVVLDNQGFLQALNYGSEGGIDLSNLPYSYACLPLENPSKMALNIWNRVYQATGKKVTVIIADTDSTFSFRGIHFTSRPHAIKGINFFKGPIPFILGRFFKLRQRATPLAVVGEKISVEDALRFSEIAHHARGSGAGRTIWNNAKTFGVGLCEVSWNMLKRIKHYPVVLIRRKH